MKPNPPVDRRCPVSWSALLTSSIEGPFSVAASGDLRPRYASHGFQVWQQKQLDCGQPRVSDPDVLSRWSPVISVLEADISAGHLLQPSSEL